MREIAFGGFDEIRNQVVPPGQLHVDLGKGVLVAVTRSDQSVVDRHEVQDNQNDNNQKNDQAHCQALHTEAHPHAGIRSEYHAVSKDFPVARGRSRAGLQRCVRRGPGRSFARGAASRRAAGSTAGTHQADPCGLSPLA
jgi:hypothetical protein